MAKRRKGLSERHKKILEVLERYQGDVGYPPSIREIGKEANISSTSVVNYYLNQLEEEGYIERDRKISRGVRLVKTLAGPIQNAAEAVRSALEDLISVPVIGRIVASEPVQVPASDFSYYDPESSVQIARNLLASGDKEADLFALEVEGDSMIDAMVNDGDIVVMKRAQDARNGEMVAVWLTDRDETTLKYFYKEGTGIRLQPANPTMQPIYVDNPQAVQIQGKVVMVIRQMESRPM
ncbi:MAG: transcriptional repressor LexA [Chloroflexi bacterium]|nr:transcriptional repressor LexA [Chloroflexota bacterium]